MLFCQLVAIDIISWNIANCRVIANMKSIVSTIEDINGFDKHLSGYIIYYMFHYYYVSLEQN